MTVPLERHTTDKSNDSSFQGQQSEQLEISPVDMYAQQHLIFVHFYQTGSPRIYQID